MRAYGSRIEEKLDPQAGTTTNQELSRIAPEGCVNVHVDVWTVPRDRSLSEIRRPGARSLIVEASFLSTAALNDRATSSSDPAGTSLKLMATAR